MSKTIKLPKNAKIDGNKLSVSTEGVIFPIKSDKSVEIRFKHICGGDLIKYYNGESVDMNKVFAGQVTFVKGIKATDDNGNSVDIDADMLVSLPFELVISEKDNVSVGTLITQVASEILSAGRLSEEETKN